MLRFERAGLHTTLQDRGRPGYQHLGVGESGVIDITVMQALNFLLARDQAVLEFTTVGPVLVVEGGAVTFAAGGDFEFDIIVSGVAIPGRCYRTYTLSTGDRIQVTTTPPGTYGYLAFGNALLVDPVLGSLSMDTRSGIGPWPGRSFQNGDEIPLGEIAVGGNQRLRQVPSPYRSRVIRYLPAPQHDRFQQDLDGLTFRVDHRKNRVGMWLQGHRIQDSAAHDIMSEGIVKGAVQITPEGEPIVLLSDHGTVGGYPKIGVVISADFENLAQMPTGSEFVFRRVDFQEADRARAFEDRRRSQICSKENLDAASE